MDKIQIFRSAQNFAVPISENPINSYDSDGGILIFISVLGDKKRKLPFFCLNVFFLGIPLTYPDVLYIAGKIFLRGIQRSWNRGKRFSGDGVIRETSLTIMAHRGGIRSGVLNRPSGGPGGDARVLSTFPGTLEKGGPSF